MRLDELAKKVGGRAKLGRELGYEDGSFIRQMISGERPITEKTIKLIDRLRNGAFRGWFDRLPKPGALSEPPAPPPGFKDRHWVDDSDWATLQAVRGTMTQEQIDDLKRRHKIMLQQIAEMSWARKP